MKIDKILDILYQKEEEQIYNENLHSSPHGHHWSTSFHASDPRDCPRKSIYNLLDCPKGGPINRQGRAIMEAGKAIEDSIVWRFHRGGILLSAPPDEEFQTQFEDEDIWLSAAPDAIIRILNTPHIVEIKSKDNSVIEEMQSGNKIFDPDHAIQLLTQLGLASDNCNKLWPDLNPIKEGTILYVSRDRPSNTFEFTFQHDEKLWQEEKDKLTLWKQFFLEDKLPPRPKEFRWSDSPCKWCPYKKEVCKPDYQEKIVDLEKSHAINLAKKLREDYDYERQRNEVIGRWKTLYI